MGGKKIEHKRHADLNHVMSDCANNPMVAQASNTMMDYFVHVSIQLKRIKFRKFNYSGICTLIAYFDTNDDTVLFK